MVQYDACKYPDDTCMFVLPPAGRIVIQVNDLTKFNRPGRLFMDDVISFGIIKSLTLDMMLFSCPVFLSFFLINITDVVNDKD
jgi:hypothetical protein